MIAVKIFIRGLYWRRFNSVGDAVTVGLRAKEIA